MTRLLTTKSIGRLPARNRKYRRPDTRFRRLHRSPAARCGWLADEIDPDELHGPAPLAGPAPHRPQQVAVTAAEIDECQRLFHRHILGRTVEPTNTGQCPIIAPLKRARSLSTQRQFGALDLGTIEPFPSARCGARSRLATASGRSDPCVELVCHAAVRNSMVSAVNPGPNDIAQPLCPRASERSRFSITNMTVADDMLP